MKRNIIVYGWGRMASLAREILKNMTLPSNLIVEITDLLVEKLRENPGLREEYQLLGSQRVLIGGDRTSLYLREQYNIPMIPIKVTGFDLMEALIEARQYDSEVALVNFYSHMEQLEKCQEIIKVKINQYVYAHQKDARNLIKILKEKGCKVIIGASLACQLADENGIKAIFMYTRPALREALRYAVDLINSYQQETERAETFKAIVDFTHSGIIGTNSEFKITTFNPSAEKILGIKSGDVIGKQFNEFFPEFQVTQKGANFIPKINSLGAFDKSMVVFSSLPILVDGHSCGQVTVLQDTASIQIAEEKIRHELHRKHFTAKFTFNDIVGKSPAIRKAVEEAKRFSLAGTTVLITGETGTGKELFAQSIHNFSSRKAKPFVAVNCAALPESLLDSELFGYEQGSFTGARKGGKPGLFEMAHTGTIFLDEASEISPTVQARLLRVLQEKVVMRIGGEQLIPVDVRVIAATNRNLWELVQMGKFREDLYYRLSVLDFYIPPVRDRKDDIPHLITAVLRRISPQMLYYSGDLVLKAFSEISMYSWPGNVRELENILERFVALSGSNTTDLKKYTSILKDCFSGRSTKTKSSRQINESLQIKINETEASEIQLTLKSLEENKTQTAQALGISRSTLYRKLKKLNKP